jgi:hypothetical protein
MRGPVARTAVQAGRARSIAGFRDHRCASDGSASAGRIGIEGIRIEGIPDPFELRPGSSPNRPAFIGGALELADTGRMLRPGYARAAKVQRVYAKPTARRRRDWIGRATAGFARLAWRTHRPATRDERSHLVAVRY